MRTGMCDCDGPLLGFPPAPEGRLRASRRRRLAKNSTAERRVARRFGGRMRILPGSIHAPAASNQSARAASEQACAHPARLAGERKRWSQAPRRGGVRFPDIDQTAISASTEASGSSATGVRRSSGALVNPNIGQIAAERANRRACAVRASLEPAQAPKLAAWSILPVQGPATAAPAALRGWLRFGRGLRPARTCRCPRSGAGSRTSR